MYSTLSSRQIIFVICAPLFICSLLTARLDAQQVDVWFGSGGPEGVFHSSLDINSGKLTPPKQMNTLGRSGFLALHPELPVLYATAQKDGKPGVASYEIKKNKNKPMLSETSFQETTDGGAACVAVGKKGKLLFSAQYGGGSTCLYRLNESGKVVKLVEKSEHGEGSGVVAGRQKTAHPHWVGTTPDNQFLCVPDLGKDCVVVYELKEDKLAKFGEVKCPPGGGPRHMKFDRTGRFAFVLNELTLSMSLFRWQHQTGNFEAIKEVSALPKDERDPLKHSAAEVRVHPNNKFVYSSNRGEDTISIFRFDASTAELTLIKRVPVRGSWPRNFNIDPSGKWLIAAGQKSNTIALFALDPETGMLTFTRTIFNVPNPICVEFGAVKH